MHILSSFNWFICLSREYQEKSKKISGSEKENRTLDRYVHSPGQWYGDIVLSMPLMELIRLIRLLQTLIVFCDRSSPVNSIDHSGGCIQWSDLNSSRSFTFKQWVDIKHKNEGTQGITSIRQCSQHQSDAYRCRLEIHQMNRTHYGCGCSPHKDLTWVGLTSAQARCGSISHS